MAALGQGLGAISPFFNDAYASFPQTRWTWLLDARQREALCAELCGRYWAPLRAYVLRMGFDTHDADDLVQSFFTDKVLGQQLMAKADRSRGRLRSFLVTALRNHVIDQMRRRGRQQSLPEAWEVAAPDELEDGVERAWAEAVLGRVLEELQQECLANGRGRHWAVFEAWLLTARPKGESVTMGEVCRQCGVAEPSQAYNMLHSLKRRFRTILSRHLQAEGEATDGEALDQFIRAFSFSPAR